MQRKFAVPEVDGADLARQLRRQKIEACASEGAQFARLRNDAFHARVGDEVTIGFGGMQGEFG